MNFDISMSFFSWDSSVIGKVYHSDNYSGQSSRENVDFLEF